MVLLCILTSLLADMGGQPKSFSVTVLHRILAVVVLLRTSYATVNVTRERAPLPWLFLTNVVVSGLNVAMALLPWLFCKMG